MPKNQQQLFETSPPEWTLDDQKDWLAARVVFARPPHGPYDYRVPDHLRGVLEPGMRVLVPLGHGNRQVEAYCIQLIRSTDDAADSIPVRKLKPVAKPLDQSPLVPGSLLQLADWMSKRWLCSIGKAIETIVPAGVRAKSNLRQAILVKPSAKFISGELEAKVTAKQQRVLDILVQNRAPMLISELAAAAECSSAPVNTLCKMGVLETTTRIVEKTSFETALEEAAEKLVLNNDQQAAFDAIKAAIHSEKYSPCLLHGITGSGKTEVYIRAIEEVIQFGRQAIVLVPEISLTPQTRRRFRARFERVAVLHSNLTGPQRAWHWRQIASGNIQVVVGARSAIFAPLPHLGLVVVDEEHDSSFKQDKAPRYHARDVAMWRSAREKVPLILGSATPALETWQRANEGKIKLLTLPERVLSRPLPNVSTVDLRVQNFGRKSFPSAISRQLYSAMRDALSDGGQVILLLNRRGFSTTVQCVSCGYVAVCDDCAIPYTHHRDRDLIICHYCDSHQQTPSHCPKCASTAIRFSGLGTQKLEHEIKAKFPSHTVARMDTDSMQRPGSHEQVLKEFRAGKTDILMGTQMIAKGLDFPNVTLVGVINADTALHLNDFRAAEKTFTLVTQVAGRSGRGPKGGRVLVQTFCPDHPAIVAAVDHNYEQFAAGELKHRKYFKYPPCGFLARVIIRGEEEVLVARYAKELADHARELASKTGDVRIVGPAIAPISKLRGKFRHHFLAQSEDQRKIHKVMVNLQKVNVDWDDVQYVIDIDPYDMM